MTIKRAWELLEIEPTQDKREIRKAYARAVKKYHPEESPQEFQEVYAAYKQVMEYAENSGNGQIFDVEEFMWHLAQQNQWKNEAEEKSAAQEGQDGQAEGEVQESEEERMGKIFRDIGYERKKENIYSGTDEKEESGEEGGAQESEEERIQKMFQDIRKEKEKRLFIFRHKWQWFLRNQNSGRAEREMRAYIQTPWFTDIMDEPTVITQLAMGIDRYCRNSSGALKEAIWQLYDLDGFGVEDEQKRYQTLFNVLEAHRFRMKMKQEALVRQKLSQEAERKLKKAKNRERMVVPGVIAAGMMCIFASLLVVLIIIPALSNGAGSGRLSEEQEKEKLISFLEETYPMAEFIGIELSDVEECKEYLGERDGDGRYYVADVADSDVKVHLYAAYQNGQTYIFEDFGKQSIRRMAEEWDVICDLYHTSQPWNDGGYHYLMLGYYQISQELGKLEGELKEYMERFRKFAQSEEVQQFENIEGVSFAVINCYRPAAFIMDAGGMPEPLLYGFGELPEPEVMAEDMANCLTEYYIHMEPWQLESDPKYPEWVEWYEERVKNINTAPTTIEGSAVADLAEELGVGVVIYQYSVFDCISLGDMYRLAQKAGLLVYGVEDGSGFVLEKDGVQTTYLYENLGEVICPNVIEKLTEE